MIRKISNISTIKDVAEKAGVSTTTVSHVINKTRYVSEDLIQRVGDAIEKLNYRPSGLARSLRTRASGTIGIVIPDNTNPFLPRLFAVLRITAMNRDIRCSCAIQMVHRTRNTII